MALKDHLDLHKAYKRVQQDKRDDTLPDVSNYRDYEMVLEENLEILRSQVAKPKKYEAKMPFSIDIPKKGFSLRPVASPQIDDRIVYQAIADFLAPNFIPEPCVYSNLISSDINSSRIFKPGVQLWLKFKDDAEKLCHSFAYVVTTDITAYFEHISHDLLIHRMQDLFSGKVDPETLDELKTLLPRLLRRWNKNKRYGLPQVNDASSFFGNIFLDELDKAMLRHGYAFLRYVDDMRIFTTDEPSARRALADLIIQLREMGLYIASGKTSIKSTAEMLTEIQDNSRKMNAIEEELNSKSQPRVIIAVHMLEEFINELISTPEKFDDRQFRYCVNRFKRLKVNGLALDAHENVANEVLSRLTTLPYATDTFVDYLSLFPESENVQRRVIDFLEGPYNIYSWQEMMLLELLIRLDILPEYKDRALSVARTIAKTSNKHHICREKAFVFWGKNGDYQDRREIRGIYHDEPREDVRRSIMFAIQEMQEGERKHFLESVMNDSNNIGMTAQYLLAKDSPQYHYYDPPKGFDIAEDWLSNDIDDLPMHSP
jgi:hypothetical protein